MSAGQHPLREGTQSWRIGVINGTNMSNLINRDPARFGPPQTIGQLESLTPDRCDCNQPNA